MGAIQRKEVYSSQILEAGSPNGVALALVNYALPMCENTEDNLTMENGQKKSYGDTGSQRSGTGQS